MNQIKIYFLIAFIQVPDDPVVFQVESQDYSVFTIEKGYHLTFSNEVGRTRLLVPNNTQLAQQIKENASKRGGMIFAAPVENLKFRSELSFTQAKGRAGNSLLVKKVSQVEKLGQTSQDSNIHPEPQSITFKVISQTKGKENQ
jgi:hypothetical protein